MKVLLLTHSDNGGAGKAAKRLHVGLQTLDVASQLLVQVKSSEISGAISQGEIGNKALHKLSTVLKLRERLDYLPLNLLYQEREPTAFSPRWVPDQLPQQVRKQRPDIVNLHWTGHGLLQIESLAKFESPLVWTLHDMWAFTGGCHYTGSCTRYTQQCGACPQLNSSRDKDLSRWIWKRKQKAWKSLNLTIVTPSHWLADCARKSSLLQDQRIEVIPNGIDVQIYKPLEKTVARHALNLPQDRQLILFGAMLGTRDRRKGFHLLKKALNKLSRSTWHDRIALVTFGNAPAQAIAELGFTVHALGYLHDEPALALAYSAADVFVAPSLEDNLPNTILEASACGTPSIGFDIGGMRDLIEPHQTGYLCRPFETDDLMQGIIWVLEDSDRHLALRKAAREKVITSFSDRQQAQRYRDLFADLIEKTPR